jgi:NAD(P)-dependent dehydrogenase (short-subunit alcohol dehydrogenase family)
MPNRLAQEVALITGAGAGIGRATALLFAQEAAKVVVQDLNAAAVQGTAELMKKAGGEAAM